MVRSRKAKVAYAADFETTTDPDDCRVWLWGIAPIEAPSQQAWGTSIESFIHRITKADSVISFHNLKFDGTFILDWLLKNDYTHFQGDYAGEEGSFKTLISDMGKFYSITVYWFNGKVTEFRDSVKKSQCR